MSVAISLLEDLTAQGVNVVLDGDRVTLKGDRAVLTPEHVIVLRQHRGEVVAFLQSRERFPHGRTVSGSPRTWSGKVVSSVEWRSMTSWERHGSTGRNWNGQTQAWEDVRCPSAKGFCPARLPGDIEDC